MTIKQRDYLKSVIEEEKEFGMFEMADSVIKMLGGKYWEKHYGNISNDIVSDAIKILKNSITQSTWAIEHGYE